MVFKNPLIKKIFITITNIGPTNVRRYKPKTYKCQTVQSWVELEQMSDSSNFKPVQTSDQYKRQTSTNVRPVQTPNQYKRQTSTNVGLRKKNYLNFKI